MISHTLFSRFDVIGKFETIKNDTDYISSEADLQIGSYFPWSNRKGSVTEVSQRYFKEIDTDSIRRLHQIYRIDFEMFEYSSEEYFNRTD